ncbi:MAG: hypothetical protein JW751_24760, partial [Polyangiaceae bacterium]|nr:hypothetical protein [Polyangiaceae bacterium]
DADEIEHSKNRRQVIVRATGDLDGDGVKCSAARAHQSCSPASGNNVWKRPSGRGCVVGSSAALGLSGTEQHLEAPQ